jgi:hypothetical protein
MAPELDRQEFIDKIRTSDSWAMMATPDNARLELVVMRDGNTETFVSPNLIAMDAFPYGLFMEQLKKLTATDNEKRLF